MSELYLFTNMNNDRFVGTIILETEKTLPVLVHPIYHIRDASDRRCGGHFRVYHRHATQGDSATVGLVCGLAMF